MRFRIYTAPPFVTLLLLTLNGCARSRTPSLTPLICAASVGALGCHFLLLLLVCRFLAFGERSDDIRRSQNDRYSNLSTEEEAVGLL